MSPVNVRPSWVNLSVDGQNTIRGTGPKSRNGSMTACFSVRSDSDVLPVLDVECIASGDKKTVLMRVTDIRTGKVLFEEGFVQ